MNVAADDPIRWTDQFTAVGTVVLGVAALLTIIISLWFARKQQASGRQDRADAAANLEAERAYNDQVRLRDRQAGHALHLLEVIDQFQQIIRDLPLLTVSTRPFKVVDPWSDQRAKVAGAIDALRVASQTTGVLIGNAEISSRVSNLLRLAEFASELRAEPDGVSVPAITDLTVSNVVHQKVLGYSIFVQIGLRELSLGGDPQPNSGPPFYPILNTVDRSLWFPNPTPATWQSMIESNPLHPQYRKLSERRGE